MKRIGAPMLGLMLRKRVAELAGITQAELEQRFEIRGRRPAPAGPAGREPALRAQRRSVRQAAGARAGRSRRCCASCRADLPRPRQTGAEAAALLDLIEEARAVSGGAERGRRDGAAARTRATMRCCSACCRWSTIFKGFSVEELAVEVRACIEQPAPARRSRPRLDRAAGRQLARRAAASRTGSWSRGHSGARGWSKVTRKLSSKCEVFHYNGRFFRANDAQTGRQWQRNRETSRSTPPGSRRCPTTPRRAARA